MASCTSPMPPGSPDSSSAASARNAATSAVEVDLDMDAALDVADRRAVAVPDRVVQPHRDRRAADQVAPPHLLLGPVDVQRELVALLLIGHRERPLLAAAPARHREDEQPVAQHPVRRRGEGQLDHAVRRVVVDLEERVTLGHQASLDCCQMLMPASTACLSISVSSSSENWRLSSAATLVSSCATEEAPMSADVTRSSRSTQASAI